MIIFKLFSRTRDFQVKNLLKQHVLHSSRQTFTNELKIKWQLSAHFPGRQSAKKASWQTNCSGKIKERGAQQKFE